MADKTLRDSAEAFVDEVWEDVVADIDRLVQVKSLEDKEHAAPGMPFGPGPREALDRALAIAERLGLTVTDMDGYVGYADLEGTGDAYLATIAHADIVPLGTGWTVDPLRVTRREGYLLGRGVLDDKGPLVLSLYAAHFFAREVARTGERLPRTLRCIVGTNEETGMEDVEHYLAHRDEPAFCFTPDAVFPLICGEKGRFFAEVASGELDAASGRIARMEGGTVANAVPGEAMAVVRANVRDLPAREGIALGEADEAGCVKVVATGKGGHASMPEGTANAIGLLVSYLLDNDVCTEDERRFLEFERELLADAYGRALGIAATDDVFDALTCVGGTVRTQGADGSLRFVQTMDVRYPKSVTGESLLAAVAAKAKGHGCAVCAHSDMVPFYVSPDCAEVRALVDTYNEVTGRHEEAFTIGGGTYARHFARAAAFGPDDPNETKPAWVGIEHGPDEGVSEASLRRALLIYILAIARLEGLGLRS